MPSPIQAIAGNPNLERLLASAHRRLERSGGDLQGCAVTVKDPSGTERMAIDRLLGTRSRSQHIRVSLERLDAELRQRTGICLLELVEEVVGPVRDLPGTRRRGIDLEEEMWSGVLAHPAAGRHPELAEWLEQVRRSGRWRSDPDFRRHIMGACEVLSRLPSPVPIGRSRLAASVLGSSHALNPTEPVGRLVAAALAHLVGSKQVMHSAERRRIWASMGVDGDETSSTVLVLGLRPVVCGPLTEAARIWAAGGIPLPLSLGALQREQFKLEPHDSIKVCENPSVLHAASDRLGPNCPPMICTEGNPSVAAAVLITSLIEQSQRLEYHGDFGSGGIAIGNRMIGAMGARPWRFSTADYISALDRPGDSGKGLLPVKGRVPSACWDDDLAPAIRAAGVEVEEELVLDLLIEDLQGGQHHRPGS